MAIAESNQPFTCSQPQPVAQALGQPYVTMLVPVIVNASGPLMQPQAGPMAVHNQDYAVPWTAQPPSSPQMGPMANFNGYGYTPYVVGGGELAPAMEDEEGRSQVRRRRRMQYARAAQPKVPGMIQKSACADAEDGAVLSKERCDALRQQLQSNDGLSLAMSEISGMVWPWSRDATGCRVVQLAMEKASNCTAKDLGRRASRTCARGRRLPSCQLCDPEGHHATKSRNFRIHCERAPGQCRSIRPASFRLPNHLPALGALLLSGRDAPPHRRSLGGSLRGNGPLPSQLRTPCGSVYLGAWGCEVQGANRRGSSS